MFKCIFFGLMKNYRKSKQRTDTKEIHLNYTPQSNNVIFFIHIINAIVKHISQCTQVLCFNLNQATSID